MPSSPFLMEIEDIFTVTGRGTVVTGRIEHGIVRVGDEVEIVGFAGEKRKVVCTGVEMFNKMTDTGFAGDNVGLVLRGVKHEEIQRGQVLAKPSGIPSSSSPNCPELYHGRKNAVSMDFFQHQEKAKNQTMFLIVLYILALLFTLVLVGILVACLAPPLVPLTIGGVLLLILGGSIFETIRLSSGGGKVVAEMSGGRLVSPDSDDLAERRLYNVAEETALAAGIPVPPVYILDDEPSINAFAAGFSPNDGVIGVNRGTVELLTRDELQGIIGHEFAHILNGDMRIDTRLMGILHGLQLLSQTGYHCMRLSFHVPQNHSQNQDDKNNGGLGPLMLLGGIGIMIIGYIGVFFSTIIKSAVSRQREFLADASAVRFTQNPDGIAGALKKIGCRKIGSRMKNEHALEMSHMFFGNVFGFFSLGNLFATHPNLTVRIRRIDPSFNGRFPEEIHPIDFQSELDRPKLETTYDLKNMNQADVIERIGQLDMDNVVAATAVLDSIPAVVSDDARNTLTAKATFYAMLLDVDPTIRQKQLNSIALLETDFVVQHTGQIFTQLHNVKNEARIPLVHRILSSLRQLTVEQYKLFSAAVNMLIDADQMIDCFEYMLKAMLLRDLDVFFGLAPKLSVKYSSIASVTDSVVAVASYFAYMGHGSVTEAQAAYEASVGSLGIQAPIQSMSDCSISQFDNALRALAETAPSLKKRVFEAMMTCIHHDGQITVRESELIRAIAAMLAIPMPSFWASPLMEAKGRSEN